MCHGNNQGNFSTWACLSQPSTQDDTFSELGVEVVLSYVHWHCDERGWRDGGAQGRYGAGGNVGGFGDPPPTSANVRVDAGL